MKSFRKHLSEVAAVKPRKAPKKFPGYWAGKDSAKASRSKMVGGESVTPAPSGQDYLKEFENFQEPAVVTGLLNELSGYKANNLYKNLSSHKRYNVYVSKQKFKNLYFIAVAENPRTLQATFKAKGQNPEEAVNNLKLEIDKEIDVATKVSGYATLDFNVEFAKDILELSTDTFYAKINPGPQLVLAGAEIMEYPEIMRDEGFKPSTIRTYKGGEGTTLLPGVPLSSKAAMTANLIANGRYVLGDETIDKDGNRVFNLTFDSVVQASNDKMRMRAPAVTIGTNRSQGVTEAPIEMDPAEPMNPMIHNHQGANPAKLQYRMARAAAQFKELAKRAENGSAIGWESIARQFGELAMNVEQIKHGLDELAAIRKKGGKGSRGIDPTIGEAAPVVPGAPVPGAVPDPIEVKQAQIQKTQSGKLASVVGANPAALVKSLAAAGNGTSTPATAQALSPAIDDIANLLKDPTLGPQLIALLAKAKQIK